MTVTTVKKFTSLNLLKPIEYLMHQQINIQQLYALSTLYVFCFYLRTKSDLCHLQHKILVFITEMKSVHCAVRIWALTKTKCATSVKG